MEKNVQSSHLVSFSLNYTSIAHSWPFTKYKSLCRAILNSFYASFDGTREFFTVFIKTYFTLSKLKMNLIKESDGIVHSKFSIHFTKLQLVYY